MVKLESKHVLVGISGGIAAYKTAYLVRLLKKQSAEVRVVMTDHAKQFITPLTMATVSENPVAADMFEKERMHEVPHISWAEWSDLAIIAPATANIIGKAANGIADDMLSSMILALQCPVIFAPAMHHQMWSHPAVQRNIETLISFGYKIVYPDEGELASGDIGIGRMREPQEIVDCVLAL